MKTRRSLLPILLIFLFSSWLTVRCNSNSNDATPQSTCRIQQYVSVSKSADLKTNTLYQIDYAYEPPGNLAKTVTTFTKQITGSTDMQNETTTVSYTYDAEGYLTKIDSQQKATNILAGKTKNEQSSVVSNYVYTNGRLSGINTRRVGAYGVNTTVSESYEYDGTGDLAKKIATITYGYDPAVATEIPVSPSGGQQISTYQKNQLVDYVEKSGSTDYRPFTIQNGLVTMFSTTPNFRTVWEYDGQKRQAKIADYVGDTLTRTTSQTWSDAKPATASLPAFKGFPATIPSSDFGQPGVLATSTNANWNSISKKMETSVEQTSVIQTNSQGFVTNVVTTAKNPAAVSQNYITTDTYTYAGCQ
ncbi:hypothetical protein BH09BAC4_BH09BAC4_42920 [soil metagenome]